MKKLSLLIAGALCAAAAVPTLKASATGWPSAYEGVMLQGFYWDSWEDTKWTNLEAQADEFSNYFKLVWIPNAGRCSNAKSMGYDPVYWFTNFNSSFGNETELRSLIQTYKSKGIGVIADVVINHRNGATNWYDFPAEEWNGTTYHITDGSITANDEVWRSGQNIPSSYKGAYDTGDDFGSSRDLDHTNANVQNNCKAYCKFLLDDMGYAGFRYDMVKGYGGQYTKIYNQYSHPTYSVGEYWDRSYDAVAAWIDATGKESAAFDFPFKYAVNDCFNNGNDYTKLAWKALGTTDQPAGMIHFGYGQYAVTFIDNHDTYRDSNKMSGDVLQANAFMLASPGTPCVFLPHYKAYKSQIQAMIKARNNAGVTNTSPVKVIEMNGNCYVAEITGSKGKLWLKLGNSSRTPGNGYTKAASGNGYEMWTTTSGGQQGGGDDPVVVTAPATLHVIGEVNGNGWAPNVGVPMTKKGNKFTAEITVAANSYFSFAVNLADSWDNLNAAGNRYAPATDTELTEGTKGKFEACADGNNAKAFFIKTPGTYTITADFETMTAYIGEGGDDPNPDPDPDPDPDPVTSEYYLIGNISADTAKAWVPGTQVPMKKAGAVYTVTQEIVNSGNEKGYFSIVTNNASSWDGDDTTPGINSTDRFGAPAADAKVTLKEAMPVTKYTAGVDASSAKSWCIAPGTYDFVFDPANMTLTVSEGSGVETILDGEEGAVTWYNLQGQRVEKPANGIFIRVSEKSVRKVLVK